MSVYLRTGTQKVTVMRPPEVRPRAAGTFAWIDAASTPWKTTGQDRGHILRTAEFLSRLRLRPSQASPRQAALVDVIWATDEMADTGTRERIG